MVRVWVASAVMLTCVLPSLAFGEDVAPPAQPQVTAPVLKRFVDASYPAEALKSGVEAVVVLLVVMDEQGKVTDVELQQPAGHGFDEAAIEAVKQFEFEPALMDGTPVAVRVGYAYHFKIEKKEVKTEPGQLIDGAVKERGVGLPVVGAEIALIEAKVRMTTDGKGKFLLRNIEPGKYKAVVTSPEYKRLDAELVVEADKTLQVTLHMDPLLENPYETVVRGKKEEAVVTKYVIEERALETVPGTFGDPLRVIETLPGVARSPWGVGMLVIRGATPQESKVFVDGVEVPLMYHFFGGPSILYPNFMDQIGYYPGNFPVKYGFALAGVVDVSTKTEPVDVASGELDLNLINTAGYLESGIGEKGQFRLGARRSYVDGVIAGAMAAAGEEGTVVAPVFYDHQLQLSYDLDSRNRVGVFWFGSRDSLELVTTDEEDDFEIDLDSVTLFEKVVGFWKYGSPEWSAAIRPFYGRDSFLFETPVLNMDAVIDQIGVRADVEWRLHERLALHGGMEGGVGFADFTGHVPLPPDYRQPGSDVYGHGGPSEEDLADWNIDETYYAFAPYVQANWEMAPGLMALPGFRSDVWHHPGGTLFMWDPRLTVRWDIGAGVVAKGGVGKFSKPPDPQYTDESWGNPDLEPSWAMHYSAGAEWEATEEIGFDLVGFYVDRRDLPVYSSGATETESGEIEPTLVDNGGKGRSYGLEFILRHRPSERFFGWLSYTLSRAELAGFGNEMGPGSHGAEQAKSTRLELSPFDQTHILSLVGSLKLGRGWETGLRVRYVSGNPETPVLGGRFLGDNNSYQAIVGTGKSRQPPFFQVDVRAEKEWTFETWMLSLYLDIQNVTNQANTEFIAWDYRFRESWNVPGVPILPSLGVEGRF